LGTGGKSEQLAHLQLIIGAQVQGIPAGLVSKRNLFNSAKELAKLAGHKDAQSFFVDPDAPPDPNDQAGSALPPPPDPKMAELQAKAQIEQVQAQADIATHDRQVQTDAALKEKEFMHKSALEERKAQLQERLALLDAQIKQEQHQAQMHAQQQKLALDQEHQVRTAAIDENVSIRKAHLDAQAKAAAGGGRVNDSGQAEVHPQIANALDKLAEALTKSHETVMQAIKAPRRTDVHRDPKTRRVTHATSTIQ
jgi:hypothetical protein